MFLRLSTHGLDGVEGHWTDGRTLWVTEAEVAQAKVLKNQYGRHQIPEMTEELWQAKKSKHHHLFEIEV
jgi:hypothetical protein